MKFIKNIVNNWKWYQKLKKQRKEDAINNEEQEIENLKALVNEYNLIQEKKSNLSKNQRDLVELKISRLIRTGKLEVKI